MHFGIAMVQVEQSFDMVLFGMIKFFLTKEKVFRKLLKFDYTYTTVCLFWLIEIEF